MPRRILEGSVVGDQNDKTITVLVERRFRHPVYKKYVMRTDKYRAHDEDNSCKVGDRVSIIECPPISKKKRWTLLTDAGAAGDQKGAANTSAPKAKADAPKDKDDKASKTASAKVKADDSKKDDSKKAAKKPAAKKTTSKKKDA